MKLALEWAVIWSLKDIWCEVDGSQESKGELFEKRTIVRNCK